MWLIKIFISAFLISFSITVFSQTWVINVLDSGHKSSLRGLCVVDDNIIWASGSNGTVALSLNGGNTFEWLTVKGFEQRDFRDIEAVDANTAIIMAVAEPAIILKTKDGGKNWYKVFEDTIKGMFLDAMDFADEKNGVVVGDPIPIYENCIYKAYTIDGGESWTRPQDDCKFLSPVEKGEAMFASSGTNVIFKKAGNTFTSNRLFIVTGGMVSSFLSQKNLTKQSLPLLMGKESTGANSLASFKNKMIIVGGDFANDKDSTGNCLQSFDEGKTWVKPLTSPHGYRSCVEYITKDKLITCGTSGVDISNDGGNNWQYISTQSFHVCQKAKKGVTVFLAGANGKIARLKTPN